MISLFFSFLSQLSRGCQIFRRRESKFLEKDEITCLLKIESGLLKRYHQCSHKKIENCIISVLQVNNNLDNLK